MLPVWGNPFERLRVTLSLAEPFRWAEAPLLDLLLFAPAAGFIVAACVERGVSYQRAALLVSAAGALSAVGAELARGLVGYALSWSAPIVHVCALIGGAWSTAALLPGATRVLRGRYRPMVLYMFYVPLLALWQWRPFVFERGLRRIAAELSFERFIPLYAYRERMDLFTAADALIPVLLFFPLGCLLVVWPLRRRGPLGLLLPALWLAIVLEVVQILLAGRLFDVTDILLQVAGAGLGWVLLRQAGFGAYGEVMSGKEGTGKTDKTDKTERSPRSAPRAQRTN
jgi:VanZ family protein